MSKNVGVLSKIRYFLPVHVLRTLYASVIEPYILRFCIEVWGNAPFCYLDRLLKIRKSSIRIVNNLPFDSHTAIYFKQSKILNVSKLYKYHILLLVYKAVHFNKDPLLFNHAITHSQVHTHLTRNADSLLLPRFNLSKTQICVSYVGTKLWNEIPFSIRMSNSFSIYRKKLFLFLVES